MPPPSFLRYESTPWHIWHISKNHPQSASRRPASKHPAITGEIHRFRARLAPLAHLAAKSKSHASTAAPARKKINLPKHLSLLLPPVNITRPPHGCHSFVGRMNNRRRPPSTVVCPAQRSFVPRSGPAQRSLFDTPSRRWYYAPVNRIAPQGTLIQRGRGTGPMKPRQPGSPQHGCQFRQMQPILDDERDPAMLMLAPSRPRGLLFNEKEIGV